MTMGDGGGPPVFFAQAPAAAWPDDGSECRWCSILLGPAPAAVAGSAPGEHGRVPFTGWHREGARRRSGRVRPVMLRLAALTVRAASTVRAVPSVAALATVVSALALVAWGRAGA
ncbi:hypothetical protein ACPYPG_01280 [Streptomyces sp. FR-108]|uniref:hypothetical protein n=1 Tax=Streptomyces sp. FR-108 TaxID=3416665 RepID=UPI003CF7302C